MATPDKILECPICLDFVRKPIIQCKTGHSMCKTCVEKSGIKKCPRCHSKMSNTGSYALEQIVDSFNKKSCKIKCCNSEQGCKYLLVPQEKPEHESECRYRTFGCEGKKFADWECPWTGTFFELEKHFKRSHIVQPWMSFKTEADIKFSLKRDFSDLQIINFHNGQNYFWYKNKIDVAKQKVYWVIQLIGTKKAARNYYYEFEIYNGPVRKYKVTEICDSDSVDAHRIFETEKCVTVSFKVVKSFLNEDGTISFKFRIMNVGKLDI